MEAATATAIDWLPVRAGPEVDQHRCVVRVSEGVRQADGRAAGREHGDGTADEKNNNSS